MADISTLFTAIGIVVGIINSIIGAYQIYLTLRAGCGKGNTDT